MDDSQDDHLLWETIASLIGLDMGFELTKSSPSLKWTSVRWTSKISPETYSEVREPRSVQTKVSGQLFFLEKIIVARKQQRKSFENPRNSAWPYKKTGLIFNDNLPWLKY